MILQSQTIGKVIIEFLPFSVDSRTSAGEEPDRKLASRAKSGTCPSLRSVARTLERSLSTSEEPEFSADTCAECGLALEQFDEETLNLCVVVLSTFVHQNPSMAIPLLLRILQSVGRCVCCPSLFFLLLDRLSDADWINTELPCQFFFQYENGFTTRTFAVRC